MPTSHGVRRRELASAAEIIGYDEVDLARLPRLGHARLTRERGPRCFARADLDEAVGRLVEIIRRERPHVIVTYPDDQEGYPHPDHLRVHDISDRRLRRGRRSRPLPRLRASRGSR